MARIERSIEIDRPAEEVWEVLADVSRLPRFSPMTVRVTDAPARLERPGQTFKQVVRVVGMDLESDWTVQVLEPNRILTVEGTAEHDARCLLVERIDPIPSGSRLTLEADYDLPYGKLGELADKLLVERRVERECGQILENLKDLVEAAGTAAGTGASGA